MILYFLRHPPIATNGKCIGWTDVDTKKYSIPIKLLNYLEKQSIRVIYSSDLQRCYELAKMIQGKMDLELIISSSIREYNFGEWENRNWEEIRKNDSMVRNWFANIEKYSPPNGESLQDFTKRINLFIEDISRITELDVFTHEGKNLLIITHAGVIKSIIGEINGTHPQDRFKINLEYFSLTAIDYRLNSQFRNILFQNRLFNVKSI